MRRSPTIGLANTSGWKTRFVNTVPRCEPPLTDQKWPMEERVQVAKTVPFAAKQARTDFSVLLDRVRDLKPIIRDAARDTETNRRGPKKTMDHLRDAELTKLVRPAGFGG